MVGFKEKKKIGAVMVVGGGIAGIHAALTMANAGKHVYLVERELARLECPGAPGQGIT